MFNILSDKWIKTDKGTYGLMDLLENSPKLKEIIGENPLNEYAIHRFIFTFLMDALQLSNENELEKLYSNSSFDMNKINAYVDMCKSEGVSFDIFDKDRPFLQDATLESEAKSIGCLDYMQPTGTSKPFFNKEYEKNVVMSDDKIARFLTTTTLHPLEGAGNTSCISRTPIYNIVKGDNLFETLVLNLVPKDKTDGRDYGKPYYRVGIMESTKEKPIVEPDFLYALTLPIRRVRIIDNSKTMYAGKVYHKAPSWRDPYVSYKDDTEQKAEKQFYRKWGDLITLVTPQKGAPKVVEIATTILENKPIKITSYSIVMPGKRVLDIRKNEFGFPNGFTSNELKIEKAQNLAGLADKAEEYLGQMVNRVFKTKDAKSTEMKPYAMQRFHEECDAEFMNRLKTENFDVASWKRFLFDVSIDIFTEVVEPRCYHSNDWIKAMKARAALFKLLPKYDVTFDTNGGSKVSKQSVYYGFKIKNPKEPHNKKLIFDGWYSDKSLTDKWDFNNTVTETTTLYAKWKGEVCTNE